MILCSNKGTHGVLLISNVTINKNVRGACEIIHISGSGNIPLTKSCLLGLAVHQHLIIKLSRYFSPYYIEENVHFLLIFDMHTFYILQTHFYFIECDAAVLCRNCTHKCVQLY